MSAEPTSQGLLTTLGPGPQNRPLRASDRSGSAAIPQEESHAAALRHLRLHREAELPRLLADNDAEVQAQVGSAAAADGRRPDQLASYRAERRQITAVSRVVCQAVAEVLAGLRPTHQLSQWLTAEVHQKVRQRGELLARHRTNSAVQPRPLEFGAVRATRPRIGVWEVSVVFSDQHRVRACALRFEAHRRRWRVKAMELG